MTACGTQGQDHGHDAKALQQNPSSCGSDWFFLELFEWMWRDDGLALKAGAEIMVYATIYRASTHGGGAFVATNASMGTMLGFPRETISRVVNKLLNEGLIWVVCKTHGPRGGKAVKCYAVSQPAIDRVLEKLSSRQLQSRLCPVPAQEIRDDRGAEDQTNAQVETNVTFCHIGDEASSESFQQSVTNHHGTVSQCDVSSRSQCDDLSHVTKRHIGKYDASPAQTSLFDIPLISTYHISTDQGASTVVEKSESDLIPELPEEPVTLCGHTLTPNDLAAFGTLVKKSLRPVDEGYVEQNLLSFARILSEGVPAEVVLTAYDEYADYQRRMMQELGESRPMHLLNWLRQRPNKNIQYVLNRLDDEWCKAHSRTKDGRHDASPRPKPTHENPELVRCIDRGEHLWIVTDERGRRCVDGTEGIDSPTRARTLYEAMYEKERPARVGI